MVSMRYAQHLAGGHGIVWNIGAAPVDGATDFLFMVAAAALIKLGLTVAQAVRGLGFAAHLLWNLHHQINLIDFKAGELIAFRKIFVRIPRRTAVDEASVESVIRGQGYEVRYVGSAVTYNKGPETIRDFLSQRRRIFAGHLTLRDGVGYRVATLSGLRILALLLRNMEWRPRAFLWTWAVVALEVYGRYLGKRDHRRRRDHTVWEIATTTKQLEAGQPERPTVN